MNIHPAFVHFPIALLVLYTLIEIIPFSLWFPKIKWDTIKMFLLSVGFLSIIPASVTGGIASELIGESNLVEAHERAALATSVIFFGAVALSWYGHFKGRAVPLRWGLKFLAVIGLVAVFITGSLGAAIVYGSDVDPIVSFIYQLFF